MKDIKLQAKRENELGGNEDFSELNSAAILIQRYFHSLIVRIFRGCTARKLYKKMFNEELEFLGMANDGFRFTENESKIETNNARRKTIQKQHEEDYLQSLVTTKEKIAKVEGPDMRESIQDSFRQWYMEFKRIHGKFPEFPSDKQWQQPGFQFSVEDSKVSNDEDESEKPSTAESAADKKEVKKEDEEGLYLTDNSVFTGQIKTTAALFGKTWQNKDESDNFMQKHDQDIVRAEKRREVESEIKNEVFELLKEELKNLKLAVDKDKKGKKGKKDKKGKKGKKDKKGKKEKDITVLCF